MFSCQEKKIDINKINLFETLITTKGYCTMKNTINFCGLHPYYYNSYKFPKLIELYKKLFDKELEQKHIAIEDVDILYKCYVQLKKINFFEK